MNSGTCSPVCHDRTSTAQSVQAMNRDVRASPLGLMSSLVYMAGLVGCPPEVGEALEGNGWTVQRLGTLHDEDLSVIDELAEGLSKTLKWTVNPQDVADLVLVSHRAAEVAWRVEGKTSGAELLVAHHTRDLQEKIEEVRRNRLKHLVELVPAKGTAGLARWPTKLHKKLEAAGDNQLLRDDAEKTERGRWIKGLKELLEEAECPVTRGGGDLTRRYGKGRRAGTLRKHVKTWQKIRDWLKSTFDVVWPKEDWEFAMYLECRADEPCGKSIPASIFKTLMFMENAAEIPVENQICRKPALKNVLEEINAQLGELDQKFTKRAWHRPVKVVASMEDAVMDYRKKRYARGYAWYRLVKLWAGMRFSDTTGLSFKTLEWEPNGLTAVLTRTKTSGPGKKVTLLRIFVSSRAWIKRDLWLSTGFEIWQDMSKEGDFADRDFLLACPNKSLSGLVRRMAKYGMACQMSQALFKELMVDYEDAEVNLLEPGVGTVWTEHSERATLRTWASAAGVSEEVRRQLGRWAPTTDQVYERTVRANIMSAQIMIALFVKRSLGKRDVLDESLIFGTIAERMERVDYPEGVIQIQMEKLRCFGGDRLPKKLKLISHRQLQEDSEEDSDEYLNLLDAQAEGHFGRLESISSDDEEAKEVTPKEMVSRGTFVLSIIGRCKRKTLHRVGECHRVPGVHYAEFEAVGNDPPPKDQFHQSCKICFPRGVETAPESSDDEEPEDGEVSSSDSSISLDSMSDA